MTEKMYHTSMLEERAMVRFLDRFTDYPFLSKWKEYRGRIGHGNPIFAVSIQDNIPVKELTDDTSLTLEEAYMKGRLGVEDDLYGALDHFLGQVDKFSINQTRLERLLHPSNSKRNQQAGVSSHYDIGNDFYRLWLDETMNYSYVYFKTEKDTLYQTQVSETDYILEKLPLEKGVSLLDVGCGWGFLLIRAVKGYDIRETSITLSRRQYEGFANRIREEGLEKLLTVKLMDYGDLPSSGMKFDRTVSVGMVEHTGRENYGRFLDCMDKVLKPGGIFLFHFISSQKEHADDPWIKKYISPGGAVPSLREVTSLMTEHDFHILDVENLGNHYNRTSLCWEKNFKEHQDEMREMSNEEFMRIWDPYLCSCAVTFHNGAINLHQVLMSKGMNNSLPVVRWYQGFSGQRQIQFKKMNNAVLPESPRSLSLQLGFQGYTNIRRRKVRIETKQDLIQYCLMYKNVYGDYPFRDHEWAVIHHRKNKKVFAWIYRRNDEVCIDPKYAPEWIEFWHNTFTAVRPGYHLNKRYWNTVVLDNTVPDKDVKQVIGEDYNPTK